MQVLRKLFVSALAIVGTVVMFGATMSEASAAYRVTIVNRCHKTINVATHARNHANTWVTRGWYVLNPGTRKTIDLRTNNRIYYLFGYSADANTTWSGSGKPGAITKYVRDRKFTRYGSGNVHGSGWRTESFFKSRFKGSARHNRHNFRC